MSPHSLHRLSRLVDQKDGRLSIRRQCELLGLSRSSYYYQPVGESRSNLHLMSLIEVAHHKHPEWGYPRMTDHLRLDLELVVNAKRVSRLMRVMRIRSVLPRPRTSQPGEGHRIYPYLLRGLKIKGPNHVWAADITYIRIAGGFLYLVAIIDWHSRFVLSWELSNSLDTSFCLTALQTAFERWGKPEIFNTDQGAQFTSEAFTQALLDQGIAISMDGKGRALDNVFVERLWWSVKYEKIYLFSYENAKELYIDLSNYLTEFNYTRRHSSLDKQTPAQVYLGKQVDPSHGQSSPAVQGQSRAR